MGAPIFDHTDTAIGALSVSGLTSRMTPARVREIGPVTARICLEISHVLGSTRGRPEEQGGTKP